MTFNAKYMQWVSVGQDCAKLIGDQLKDFFIFEGVDVIPAGTIMVLIHNKKPYMMFQTLQDLSLLTTRNPTLVGYETGSIVFLGYVFLGYGERTLTIRFRDCRMPTIDELMFYETRATV